MIQCYQLIYGPYSDFPNSSKMSDSILEPKQDMYHPLSTVTLMSLICGQCNPPQQKFKSKHKTQANHIQFLLSHVQSQINTSSLRTKI